MYTCLGNTYNKKHLEYSQQKDLEDSQTLKELDSKK